MARPNSSDGKTEATLVKMCHSCGSGQPPADPYGYVEEAEGNPLVGRPWRNALRPTLSPLRDENLCIIRTSPLM